MAQAKKCPRCGKIVDIDEPVCPGCGHSYRTVFDPNNPQQSERPVAQPLAVGLEAPPARTTLIHLPGLRRLHRQREAGSGNTLATAAVIVVLGILAFWVLWSISHHSLPALPLQRQ